MFMVFMVHVYVNLTNARQTGDPCNTTLKEFCEHWLCKDNLNNHRNLFHSLAATFISVTQ